VQVTAARWNWRFTYPDYGVTVAGSQVPTLVVPTGTDVVFTGTSQDVIHSFWVPEMRFKQDVFPDSTVSWHLSFPHPQMAISGECGEFCGLLHASMRFFVNAVSPAQFRQWIRTHQAGPR
jgi:cytochrome c oxidase subunit II